MLLYGGFEANIHSFFQYVPGLYWPQKCEKMLL
jgi:hypothetical protein